MCVEWVRWSEKRFEVKQNISNFTTTLNAKYLNSNYIFIDPFSRIINNMIQDSIINIIYTCTKDKLQVSGPFMCHLRKLYNK